MLVAHLPKDHTDGLHSAVSGLIGIVVWRRPNVTTISPRPSSHHKHGTGAKKPSSLRRQQQNVINSTDTNVRPAHAKPLPDNEPIDDIPPGFGPASARDEDDLPEFDFNSNAHQKGMAGNPNASSLPLPPARPVEQMRELIQKYGGENTKKSGIGIQSWNDDNDDDIPEWQPHNNDQPQHPSQLQQHQQLPPPPPQLQLPPLPPQHHNNYQQQTVQQQQRSPYLVNQNLIAHMQPQMQHLQQLTPIAVPLSVPMQPQLHPQMGFMQGPLNASVNMNMNPGWQQAGLSWPAPARGPSPPESVMNMPTNGCGLVMQPLHTNFGGQPGGNGQFYGVPASFGSVPLQNGMMGWRPDVPRSNGM